MRKERYKKRFKHTKRPARVCANEKCPRPGREFIPNSNSQKYCSHKCLRQAEYWKNPDEQRRKCADYQAKNRDKINLENRTNPIKRAEKIARTRAWQKAYPEIVKARAKARWLKLAAKLAQAERILAEGAVRKPGPNKIDDHKKRFFIIGEKVEAKIGSGQEITGARRLVAREEQMEYESVVSHHKKFRRLYLRGNRVNSAPGE